MHPTEFPRDFHNGTLLQGWRTGGSDHVGTASQAVQSSEARQAATVTDAHRYGLPLQIALISAHAEAEDRKLRKELTFGGPCLEGTLQKPTLVSESSPVAGAIENSAFSMIFRCRDATRDSKIRPAATHLLSVNCLYQGIRGSASKS